MKTKAWLAVDEDKEESISKIRPLRYPEPPGCGGWMEPIRGSINLPTGSIKKLIGRELTWNDEPVMIE